MSRGGLFAAQQSFHFFPRAGVGDVGFGQAGAAGLQDAVAQHVEAQRAVGVGRNDDRNAALAAGGAVDVVQIEPRWVAVQFQKFAVFLARPRTRLPDRLRTVCGD